MFEREFSIRMRVVLSRMMVLLTTSACWSENIIEILALRVRTPHSNTTYKKTKHLNGRVVQTSLLCLCAVDLVDGRKIGDSADRTRSIGCVERIIIRSRIIIKGGGESRGIIIAAAPSSSSSKSNLRLTSSLKSSTCVRVRIPSK